MLQQSEYLKNGAQSIGVALDDRQIDRLCRYYQMVVDANKLFNLTAITDETEFVDKHIVDSLAGISEIPKNAKLCDIGAGGGFPTMPIAIAREDVNVTAIDSTAKKMNFVFACAKELGLDNVKTVAGRAEEQRALFESFDVVTARAVASLPILMELAMPLLKVGGRFIAYKTDESELCNIKSALEKLNARHISSKSLVLPNGDRRAILCFEKIAKTPSIYPRQYGTIKKKPL